MVGFECLAGVQPPQVQDTRRNAGDPTSCRAPRMPLLFAPWSGHHRWHHTIGPGSNTEGNSDARSLLLCRSASNPERLASDEESSTAANSAAIAKEEKLPDDDISTILSDADILREITSAKDADDVLEKVACGLNKDSGDTTLNPTLEEHHSRQILCACLERGSFDLALSVYEAMRTSSTAATKAKQGKSWFLHWPQASIASASALVLGLCRQLRVTDAMEVLKSIQRQGMPKSDEVPFGHVVCSPMPPHAPLAVVQPQEGLKRVVCTNTRYEFELFSGQVMEVSSEPLPAMSNILLIAMDKAQVFGKPVAAVHQVVVRAPDSTARTLRFGSRLTDIPFQAGDRVTFVIAPTRPTGTIGLLDHNPPGTQPGEPMAVTNHATGVVTHLLRPPSPGQAPGVPGWILPAAIVFAASDAATSIIDPNLPLLGAMGVAAVVASGLAGSQLLLPKLKQVPETSLQLETVQQRLLAQHQDLQAKITKLLGECADDVRTLARLWQLQTKMASVGTIGKYDLRFKRVGQGCSNLESRLESRIELLDGLCRVGKMIEIEVEMDAEVPYAELQGIEQQIEQLKDLEIMQKEMNYQVEAQEEVEQLLRTTAL